MGTNEAKRIKFWMVWNEYGDTPSYKHDTRASADQEAERLAQLHPDKAFIVLKAVGGKFCEPPKALPVKIVKREAGDDGIPF
jgi:hypothetical protein